MKSTIKDIGYLNFNAKVAFTKLRKVFTKALIFCDFDLECHILIEIDVFVYAIAKILK